MQDSPKVTAADIARLAGVGRAAVSNWRRRHADFPAPTGGTASSPEFDLAQVEAWLREQGKLPDVPVADRVWSYLAAGDNLEETLYLAAVYLTRRSQGLGQPKQRLDKPLADAVADLADELGPVEAFDELWRRYIQRETRRTGVTPDDLADLMVALVGVAGRTVLDPACGTGGLLRAAARAGATTVYGQEIDPTLARLTRRWLAIHDVPGEISDGDSLRADAHRERTVDAVLTNPPFGDTNWGQDVLGYDPRWQYGLPPRTEPELAWAQHALSHLHPGGTAVLVMPPSAASRRAGRRIRGELLRRGALLAVIALPAKVAAWHAVPLHLWVLRRPPTDAGARLPQVLLVDASEVTLPAEYTRIRDTYRAFVADPDAPVTEAGLARSVPVIELLDDQIDLTPARRQPATEPDDSWDRLQHTRARLRALLTDLPGLVPDLAPTGEPDAGQPTVSITELARTGALQILGPVRQSGQERDPGDARPVLTAPDVVRGQVPSGRAEGRLNPEVTIQRGDVLVPMIARTLTAWVAAEGGALLGAHIYLLRPNPAALDPWFLAAQLRSSTNERFASSLSGTLRFDVRRAQIPRISLDDQQRIGEAYQRLDAFDQAVRQAAELGAELTRVAADGLARGTLRPTGARDAR